MSNGRVKTGRYNRLITVAVIGVILLFHFTANLIWFSKNDVPPPWDFALHLTKSLEYSDLLTSGRFFEMRDVDDYYPPLSRIPAALAYIVFGRSETTALAANFFWFVLLVVAVYFIARRYSGNEAGLAAAVFVAFVPYFYNYSRIYALVVPTTAAVAVAILALAYTDGYRDIWRSLLFGAAMGAALLAKWSALFFVLPTAAASLFVKPTDGGPPLSKRAANFAAALGTATLLTSPWYLRHLAHIVRAARHTAVEAIAQGDPLVFSGPSFTYYLSGSIYDMGFVLFLVGLAALVYCVIRRRRGWLTVLAWAVGSYLFLTLLRNKDYRFIAPLFPAFAVTFGVAFSDIKLRSLKTVLGVLGVVYVFVIFFHSSFGIGCFPRELVWKPLRGHRYQIYTYEGPRKEEWYIREIIAETDRRGRSDGTRPNVCVVPNAGNFAEPTFKYYATRDGIDSYIFAAKEDFPSFCDYIVTKTGDQGPGGANWDAFRKIGKDEESFVNAFAVVAEYPLHDGSTGILYKREVSPNPEFELEKDAAANLLMKAYPGMFEKKENISIDYEPERLETGSFRYIEIVAEKGNLGGGLVADLGNLKVTDIEIILENVVINPWAIESDVQILSLESLSVSYCVSEAELADAFERSLSGFTGTRVSIDESVLSVESRFGNVPVSGSLAFHDDGRFVRLQIKRVSLFGIPLPYIAVVYAGSQVTPIVDRERIPFNVGAVRLTDGPGDSIAVHVGGYD